MSAYAHYARAEHLELAARRARRRQQLDELAAQINQRLRFRIPDTGPQTLLCRASGLLDSEHPSHRAAGRALYARAIRAEQLAERDQRLLAAHHPGHADGRYRAACAHADRWGLAPPLGRWPAADLTDVEASPVRVAPNRAPTSRSPRWTAFTSTQSSSARTPATQLLRAPAPARPASSAHQRGAHSPARCRVLSHPPARAAARREDDRQPARASAAARARLRAAIACSTPRPSSRCGCWRLRRPDRSTVAHRPATVLRPPPAGPGR